MLVTRLIASGLVTWGRRVAAALGKLLRGAVTTRNWNTVQKLVETLDG